ncbi:MAG TPA: amidohydrolase family protein [Polyangiaceae bacterium]|nr:amidohydrolase family protein [Polyangiaceae bacterium]
MTASVSTCTERCDRRQDGRAMIIDAHQHLWRIGQNGCSWPTPDLVAIHRDFEIEDLALAAKPLGVSGTVLVQSQSNDRDTDWLLQTAEQSDLVKAVVGWVDLRSPAAPRRIAELAGHPKMRGLRPMLQELAEDDWILDRALDPAIETMKAHRLSFDALVFPRHLEHICVFAARHPELRIVIDHAAKPPIASGALEPWRSAIARAAALTNIWCKLSGLLTEAAPTQGCDALRPVAAHLMDIFAPERLMWGSDWPVLHLAGDYAGWFEMTWELCGTRDEASQRALFAATACQFYRIFEGVSAGEGPRDVMAR